MAETKLRKALLEDVVIFGNQDPERPAAQSIAPDRPPRGAGEVRPLPLRGVEPGQHAGTRERVEEFLYYQSELLDQKQWSAYIDLFDEDGIYWMPVTADQTEWLDSPSIFAEDKLLMEVRRGRVTHPRAWSQAPAWGTSHVIGNVVIESETDREIVARSRFTMTELRRDQIRHFTGTYRHTLSKRGPALTIRLQRVDLLNAQAPFDYVLQVWV